MTGPMEETAAEAFDRAVHARVSRWGIRPETSEDRDVLRDIFVRCSPLSALLPLAMLDHQAAMQQAGHCARYPDAMRRIVSVEGVPIGRIVIDWAEGYSHCIDIAVLPDARDGAVGLHLLRAWIAVADERGLETGLMVLRDNPAVRLYRHLGFGCADDHESDTPYLTMRRSARAR